jgi:hypothetical protein
MISEIKYNGFSASPSDYESLDGDLAAVVGLVPENGALKPIPAPKPIFTLADGQRVVVLHKTSAFTHYIIQDNANSLYWSSESGALKTLCDLTGKQVYQITTIGNTVIALCDDGMHYMLWKNGDYTYLGNKIPECPISFGLQGENKLYSELNDGTFTIRYDAEDATAPFKDFSDENKVSITSQVLSKVNKFVAQVSTDENKFIFPFFVRYAYRLYDASLTHHSAPILMLPCTNTNPVVYASNGVLGSTSSELDIYAIATSLDYMPLISSAERRELNNWSDIIKSVDIFISAPIYTYDQSGICDSFGYSPVSYFFGRFIPKGGGIDDAKISSVYQKWLSSSLHSYDYGAHKLEWGVRLPSFPSSEIEGKIKDCSSFYFLTSIDINDLPSYRTEIKIEDGVLGSLVAREVMTDDYQTHDTLIPSFAQVYNNRLNIANIERLLFKGYDTAAQVCYTNGWTAYYGSQFNPDADLTSATAYLYTKVQGDKAFTLKNECSTNLSPRPQDYVYLYYPDIAAKEITLTINGSGKSLKMTPHNMLNGAVYFAGLKNDDDVFNASAPLPDANPTISLPNKIYTSEVNNPFYFPLPSINTIGTGDIIGISTAAKALSEGQFGQFPLYAFATDGVWALEVSATGAYSAKQPITRDVCLSKDSITQIDSSVLFATDRGIMLLSGSQSICISDILDSAEPFALASLPQSERLLIDFASLAASNATYLPFREYVAGCRMIYDYVQQRVVVINPNCQYAYVYSFESKAWGIMPSTLKSTVNSYPEALAMDGNNRLVDISKANTTTGIPIFFVTRPIKIEADVLKTIDTIIQRGYFKRGHVKMALYGSRDMFDWFLVSSSADHYLRGFRGTPYKYFRIAVIGALDHNESITGATIQFTPRQINQPR